MLKITIADAIKQRRLTVEGKLVGPWAAALKDACELARAELHGRDLVIDVKNLTAISQEGENTLLQMMKEGMKFSASGVFTRHVLRQLARKVACERQEVGDDVASKASPKSNSLGPIRDSR